MDKPEPAGVAIDGREVRQRRKLKGKDLGQFAAECDITIGYLSHIETGRRLAVSPPVFLRICDALGVVEDDREQLVRSAVAS